MLGKCLYIKQHDKPHTLRLVRLRGENREKYIETRGELSSF